MAIALPLSTAALLWLVKLITDDVFVAGRFDDLTPYALAFLGLSAAKIAVTYILEIQEAGIFQQIARDIRVDLYRHMISVSPQSLGRRTAGDLLTHMNSDCERVEYLIYTGMMQIVSDLASAIFFVSILLLISWKLTLAALFVVPLLFLVNLQLSPRARRAAAMARKENSNWMELAEERLGAIPVIRGFAAYDREVSAFGARADRCSRAEVRATKVQAILTLRVEALAALASLGVLIFGAYEVRNGDLTVGALLAFLGSVGSLSGPIRSLAKMSARLQRAAAGAERVAAILDTPSLVVDRSDATPLRPGAGALEFRNVSFAYPGSDGILHDVSLRVAPGETVAVVGSSGSGKSTLVRLALRHYDPSAGTVLIDGVDIRDATVASLAGAISPVFQESYVLRGSIAGNLRYGRPDASEERMLEIARATHVEQFARPLRGGYSTEVGARGSLLSGGQRQRIALARALLCDAPIVVLDEATASVDSETEELMQLAIERFAGTRTMLIVAHRLSSVMRADRVVVVEKGRVVESGTPQQLLARPGRCRELFAPQMAYGEAA